MARLYMERTNEEIPAYFAGGAAEVSRAHEGVQVISHFISHDLHGLVQHILGFVQLLHGKAYADLDNTNRHYLDTILESGKTISTLMDDLLNLARVARFETHKKELGLNKTVEEALSELHPYIAGRRINWQAERLSTVLGDLSKLLHAMSNLISNTLNFSGTQPQARNEISIRTSQTRDRIISLRGDGVDFDMQRTHRLFGRSRDLELPRSQVMSARPMISVAAATGLLEAIAARGEDPDQILCQFEIDRSAFSEPEGFIPSSIFAGVLEVAAQETADDC